MKHALLFLLLWPALATSAAAGTRVLGVEIGVTTSGQLHKALAGRVELEERGVNRWSGGDMLRSGGEGYGIDGLREVIYLFDPKGVLSGVLLSMGKASYDAVYQAVSLQYTVQRQERTFIGDRYARFTTADGIVELDAPQQAFELSVRYLRRDLEEDYRRRSRAEAAEKRRTPAAKF
jgi:hypothetical protein